jgi:hypothetical protein
MKSAALFMICVAGFIFFAFACTPQQDANIREKTQLPLGEMVKAKDRSIAAAIQESLNADPRLTQYKLKAEVSHDKIILTGTVSNEKEKQLAFDIVMKIELERIKPENIMNEIQIDSTLEPILGPDDY